MVHYLCLLFVSAGIEATALLLLCCAASLTNALVAFTHTKLELALLSHQANLVLLASSQSMLPLLVLVGVAAPPQWPQVEFVLDDICHVVKLGSCPFQKLKSAKRNKPCATRHASVIVFSK